MLVKSIGIGATAFIALIAGLIMLLWAQHNQPQTLPALTGRYPVGRTAFDWLDESRSENLAPERHAKRELTVWIWYPASINGAAKHAEYMPGPWRVALEKRQGLLMTTLLKHDLALVHPHSYEDVDIAPGQRTYPVIIMKPGIGALALDYTTLAEDLASHGYIVASSDSPYSTVLVVFHDGRVVQRRRAGNAGEGSTITEQNAVGNRVIDTWVGDDRFVLTRLAQMNKSDPTGRFKGRLNLDAIGAMGHSFGGATAAEFCGRDNRCVAGIDVDGIPFGTIVRNGINRPFMFLMSDHSKEDDVESTRIKRDIRNIYQRLPRGRVMIMLRNSGHFSFGDQPLIFNHTLARMSGSAGLLDAARGLAAATACIRTFFDINLKGAPESEFRHLKTEFPELVFAE